VSVNTPEFHSTQPNFALSADDRRLIAELRSAARTETISCAFCDADSPLDLEAAGAECWKELQVDDGLSWNYLGVCPDCAPAHN
jgi:hypothetical protein